MKHCPKCNNVMNYLAEDLMADEDERDERGWYIPKIIPSACRGPHNLARYRCPKCGHLEYAFE